MAKKNLFTLKIYNAPKSLHHAVLEDLLEPELREARNIAAVFFQAGDRYLCVRCVSKPMAERCGLQIGKEYSKSEMESITHRFFEALRVSFGDEPEDLNDKLSH
jgi:hypothetical protein